MGALSPTHWVIIIGVMVLLFGARKLPDAARAAGQSLRILKAETSQLRDNTHDNSADVTDSTLPTATSLPTDIASLTDPAHRIPN